MIAYGSRKLSPAERNYSTTEKECLAIVWTVRHWRPYLLGRPFAVVTVHQCLTWLHGLKEPKGRVTRWSLALQEYEFEIKHRPGRQHGNADTLSRFPQTAPTHQSGKDAEEEMEVEIGATEVCAPWSTKEIHEAQQNDQSISQVMQ